MKESLLLTCVICLAPIPPERAEVKTVVIDEKKFSDIYPAVWFSPSTGEVSPLKQKSEVPPAEQYEIWIEPRDPEFAFGPGIKAKGVGFAALGKGLDVFRKASRPRNPRLESNLAKLLKGVKVEELPVFYCKAKDSECVIMVTALDRKKHLLRFQWKRLKKK
jgi:hypothetical protein